MNKEQFIVQGARYEFEEITGKGMCLVPVKENSVKNAKTGNILICKEFGSKFIITEDYTCVCIDSGHSKLERMGHIAYAYHAKSLKELIERLLESVHNWELVQK